MKKILLLLVSLLLVCGTAGAQNLLKNLGERAKNAVENNLGNKVEDGVNKALDGVLGGKNKDKGNDNANDNDNSNRKSNRNNADNEDDDIAGNADDYNLVAQDAKNDFVRGSLIMFEDDMKDEMVGEFPSKWDLVRGNAEIAVINGQKCIALVDGDGWITPLVKGGIRNYLGDVFTVEYDMLFDDRPKNGAPSIELDIMHEKSEPDWELFTIYYHMGGDKQDIDCSYTRPTAEDYHSLEGRTTAHGAVVINDGRWHHYALSFNERAIKFYVDGKRVVNVPNAKAGAGWLTLWSGHTDVRPTYVKDVVIAQGAVDLYERNATDIESKLSEAAAAVEKAIAETGKFVTNNILFDTGKATLKAESMPEILKVAEYMKANPTARFEVQGHTDNQGSDAVNDPLSQQRAEAVVKALEEQGVDPFNLRPVGKGSHEPVADNSTEEGRAKNRRVEFIKK
ncbi:MAG: OmpA family protein [Bacteroidales bacterium]|nr:OmpA family protein [Bacteroidales bacterium]MBR5671542.1 OmpA family protein [Bacteroidales bacterium]